MQSRAYFAPLEASPTSFTLFHKLSQCYDCYDCYVLSWHVPSKLPMPLPLALVLALSRLFSFMLRDFLARFIRLSALRIMQHKRPKSSCSKIQWKHLILSCFHKLQCCNVSIDCPDIFWKRLMLALILFGDSQILQLLHTLNCRHCKYSFLYPILRDSDWI